MDLWTAFLLGLVGSLHCAGTLPIMLAISLSGKLVPLAVRLRPARGPTELRACFAVVVWRRNALIRGLPGPTRWAALLLTTREYML